MAETASFGLLARKLSCGAVEGMRLRNKPKQRAPRSRSSNPRYRRRNNVRDIEYGLEIKLRETSIRSRSADRNFLLAEQILAAQAMEASRPRKEPGDLRGGSRFSHSKSFKEKASSSGELRILAQEESRRSTMNGIVTRLNGLHLPNGRLDSSDSPKPRKKVSFDDSSLPDPKVPVNARQASLNDLIRQFIPTIDYFPDESYVFTFLLNARTYMAPIELLHNVLQFSIFEQNKATENFGKDSCIRFYEKIFRLIRLWTELFPYDFRSSQLNEELYEILGHCTQMNPGLEDQSQQILMALAAKLSKLERYETALENIKNQKSAQILPFENMNGIYETCQSAALIAQQLTHIELERLSMIGPEEFVHFLDGQSTLTKDGKKVKSHRTKNIEYYAEWFTRLSDLIGTEICRNLKKKHRKQVIEFFVNVAKECFNIGNFNSLMAIFAGLRLPAVTRLKKTWNKVDKSKVVVLEHQLDPSNNFGNYRATLKAAIWRSEAATQQREKIIIPFFSLFIKDLIYLHEDLLASDTTGGAIDYKKLDAFSSPIREFVNWTKVECPFPCDSCILQKLLTGSVFSEKARELASYECEPPDSPTEKEHHKQLKLQFNWHTR